MYERSQQVETLALYVDGQSRAATGGGYFDSVDPFTGKVWTRVPSATTEDVDLAVRAAHRAFTSGPWAAMTPTQRGRIQPILKTLVYDAILK